MIVNPWDLPKDHRSFRYFFIAVELAFLNFLPLKCRDRQNAEDASAENCGGSVREGLVEGRGASS
jgi:hypothetical protein